MQPPPPPRRRRRSTRAAGPSRPAETIPAADGPAIEDPATGEHCSTGPAAAPVRRPRPPSDAIDEPADEAAIEPADEVALEPAGEVAIEPYRAVDPGTEYEDRAAAPVVPPGPPTADGPRRPSRSPGGPGPEAGPFGRWPTGGRRARPARDEAGERSLRALVTSRTTQVPPTTALRAREVELPTEEDLARAEAELVIVRRNYVPPTALSTGRRSGRARADRPAEERGRRRATGAPRPTD